MTFLVGLIHHVQTVVIVQSIHLHIVRIMTRANHIHVMPLHNLNILNHGRNRNGLTKVGMDIMSVNSLKVGELVVDIKLTVLYLYFSESMFLERTFL